MSFEYKVYSRDTGKWCLLAGFSCRDHALWYAKYYLSQFRPETQPRVKLHHGKYKIKEF